MYLDGSTFYPKSTVRKSLLIFFEKKLFAKKKYVFLQPQFIAMSIYCSNGPFV